MTRALTKNSLYYKIAISFFFMFVLSMRGHCEESLVGEFNANGSPRSNSSINKFIDLIYEIISTKDLDNYYVTRNKIGAPLESAAKFPHVYWIRQILGYNNYAVLPKEAPFLGIRFISQKEILNHQQEERWVRSYSLEIDYAGVAADGIVNELQRRFRQYPLSSEPPTEFSLQESILSEAREIVDKNNSNDKITISWAIFKSNKNFLYIEATRTMESDVGPYLKWLDRLIYR